MWYRERCVSDSLYLSMYACVCVCICIYLCMHVHVCVCMQLVRLGTSKAFITAFSSLCNIWAVLLFIGSDQKGHVWEVLLGKLEALCKQHRTYIWSL